MTCIINFLLFLGAITPTGYSCLPLMTPRKGNICGGQFENAYKQVSQQTHTLRHCQFLSKKFSKIWHLLVFFSLAPPRLSTGTSFLGDFHVPFKWDWHQPIERTVGQGHVSRKALENWPAEFPESFLQFNTLCECLHGLVGEMPILQLFMSYEISKPRLIPLSSLL